LSLAAGLAAGPTGAFSTGEAAVDFFAGIGAEVPASSTAASVAIATVFSAVSAFAGSGVDEVPPAGFAPADTGGKALSLVAATALAFTVSAAEDEPAAGIAAAAAAAASLSTGGLGAVDLVAGAVSL